MLETMPGKILRSIIMVNNGKMSVIGKKCRKVSIKELVCKKIFTMLK
jgi:hypothetical protein